MAKNSSSKSTFKKVQLISPTPSPLSYHEFPVPGKIKILPSKPCNSKEDLSIAYTPGVAVPCLEIQKDSSAAYKYTSKGNLVAVITNGTAILGLGDIGPLAGKPVMEGKAVLFKRFAGIDSVDIEINEKDPEKLVHIIASLEPTFGGINLEDIKSPECFYVEQELIKRVTIPTMHDDQHGTAIICGAAFLNAIHIAKKDIQKVKIVFSGAGAAALSCAKMFINIGASMQNIYVVDSKGVITTSRTKDLTPEKIPFAKNTTSTTLKDIIRDTDVFIGLSQGNVFTPNMLLSMSKNPIVFALANPTPEIDYHLALKTRTDVIMATGRSDFPNQINNVLAFPYLFRAALDTRSTTINQEMKLACVRALAKLAHSKVPQKLQDLYQQQLTYGPLYILPKPFDPRVLSEVTPQIARAAIESGTAKIKLNIKEYQLHLRKLSRRLAKGKF